MPNYVYGGSTADFTYSLESGNTRLVQAGSVPLTIRTAPAGGGSVLTPVSGATSTATGDIAVTLFFADDASAPYEVYASGDLVNWYALKVREAAPLIAADVAAATSGFYTTPGGGIPETDLAAAVQTKLNTGGGGVAVWG